MKKLVTILLSLTIVLCFCITASADGYERLNATAKEIFENCFGNENADLTNNTIRLKKDIKESCMYIESIKEDVILDLNGHSWLNADIEIKDTLKQHTFTFTDSLGGGTIAGGSMPSAPIKISDANVIFDGGTYMGNYDNSQLPASALLLGNNINVQILSGNFIGGNGTGDEKMSWLIREPNYGASAIEISNFMNEYNDINIEQLYIADGVQISGGNAVTDSELLPNIGGPGIEIIGNLKGNPIEIGKATISGGNGKTCTDAIHSDYTVNIIISKSAILKGVSDKGINVSGNSNVQYVDKIVKNNTDIKNEETVNKNNSTKTVSPKTGDNFSALIFIEIGILFITALIVFCKKQTKFDI